MLFWRHIQIIYFIYSQYAEVNASRTRWEPDFQREFYPRPTGQAGWEGQNDPEPEKWDWSPGEEIQDAGVQGNSEESNQQLYTLCKLHGLWAEACFLGVQIDILQKTTNIYEEDKRTLQQELESREQRLQRELSEKKRMEARMQGFVSDEKLRWQKECVSRLTMFASHLLTIFENVLVELMNIRLLLIDVHFISVSSASVHSAIWQFLY